MDKNNINLAERSPLLVLGLYKLIIMTEQTLDNQIATNLAIQHIVNFSNQVVRETSV
jgi:hypothetical protein